jgi:hypothetical protein
MHPHYDVDFQSHDDEQARYAERRLERLDNAWECYQERWIEENPPVEPKPASSERLQMELDFEQSA